MEYLSCYNKSFQMDSNGLQSMRSSDKVKSINEKPSAITEGISEQNSDLAKSENNDNHNLIITEPPNLYKQIGISMSNSSENSIPFNFKSIPNYFFESAWFKNENTFKFVCWAFSRCNPKTSNIIFDNRQITLSPFEFICGREKSSAECFLTPDEFRTQLKIMVNAGFLKKTPNSKPNRFNCYIWVTSKFSNCDPQTNPRSIPNSSPILPRKQELRSKNIDNNKESSVCVFSKKVYDSLKDEPRLTNEQKIELSEKFEEDVVADAYSSALSYKEPINNFFYFLRSACQKGYRPPPVNEKVQRERENEIIDLFAFLMPVKQGNFLIIHGEDPIDLRQDMKILREKKVELWEKFTTPPKIDQNSMR